jgi:hypothetical protein
LERKRVLILFPDEWDFAATQQAGVRERYEFRFEGFDLFRFPGNARLFTFDMLAFARRVASRYRKAGISAVTTADEQFGPVAAALVSSQLGLPGTPIEAVLTAQHKYYAREAFDRIAPEANPAYGLIPFDFTCSEDVPLQYPCYVKPVKAAFSVLARRVDDFRGLQELADFGWFERAIIKKLVQPFGDAMRAHSNYSVDPYHLIAEEVMCGRQATLNGFARNGEVRILGAVDSLMYPGTDHFMRFQYPSMLPETVQARMAALAERLVTGIGFCHGMFNIEMIWDVHADTIRVVEINPRAAGQFYDLFERVDGYSLFDAVLALDSGDEPELRHRAGPSRVAASFVLRDFTGNGLRRQPTSAEIDALRRAHPAARIMFYPKRGGDLRREMKWLRSYRYGVCNIGGTSFEDMFAQYRRLCSAIDFHPDDHKVPELDSLLSQVGLGRDSSPA